MNNTAVGYVRVSTGKQREGASPDVQRREIVRYASAHNPPLQLLEIFEESKSGFQLNARVEFYRMLEYAQQQRCGHIIYYLTNRISRNTEDWQELKRANLRCHNVSKGVSFNLSDKRDWQAIIGEERDLVEGKRSSYETGFRVKGSQLENAQQGKYPGPPPLGYLPNNTSRAGAAPRYTIDPERGPLIQQMFRLFASGGYTRRQITQKAKDLGLRSRKGKLLHRSQIESYLRNPFFTGRFKWDGAEYDNHGQWEPLISTALFDECQEVFNAKRSVQRRGEDYRYRGLLKCGLCGCAFIREGQTTKLRSDGTKRFYGYYRCTYQRAKCYEAGSPRFTAVEMDQLVEAAIGMMRFDESVYEWLKSEVEETVRLERDSVAAEVKRLKVDLAQCDERRKKTWQAFTDGDFDPEFLKEEFARLTEMKTALTAALAAREVRETDVVQSALDALLIAKDFKTQYLQATDEKKRRLNHLMFSNVRVMPLKRPKKQLFADLEGALVMGEFPLEIEWNQPFADLYEIAVGERLDVIARRDWEQNKEHWGLRKRKMAPRAGLEPAT